MLICHEKCKKSCRCKKTDRFKICRFGREVGNIGGVSWIWKTGSELQSGKSCCWASYPWAIKGVGDNSILCMECLRWVHKRCSGMRATCGQQMSSVIRVGVMNLKNHESMIHWSLIPASLLGSFCLVEQVIHICMTKLPTHCHCRGQKDSPPAKAEPGDPLSLLLRWCEQTNTSDPQATILNPKAGLDPIQVFDVYIC